MISQRLHEHDNLDRWLASQSAFFTQGQAFAAWQRAAGRRVIREIISAPGEALYFQAIKYSLPFGQSYLYLPHGPVSAGPATPALWQKFKERLLAIGREEGAIFVRFDVFPPDLASNPWLVKNFLPAPVTSYHSAFFQPQYEWLVDITASPEEIFANFSKKTRYAIRTAEERGVKIEIVRENLTQYSSLFYNLMKETSRRGHFSLHTKTYYDHVLRLCETRGDGFLVIARKDGEPLVASLIHRFGEQALFVYSGSAGRDRATNATYLAQWLTIKELKKRGVTHYSLGGISPDDEKYSGWSGLGRFKRNFVGRMISFAPFLDYPLKPFWYHLYLLRKRLKKR